MNYAIYTYYKIKTCFGGEGIESFEHFLKFRKYFGILGVFCIIDLYFEYRIWILCIWLYMEAWFKNMFWDVLRIFRRYKNVPEVWTIFVRTISFWDVLGFWVLNGPLTSLKLPSEGYLAKFKILYLKEQCAAEFWILAFKKRPLPRSKFRFWYQISIDT